MASFGLFVDVANLLSSTENTEIILSLDDLCVFPPVNKHDVEFLTDSVEIVEEWRRGGVYEALAEALAIPLGEHIDRFLEIGEEVMAGQSV